MSLSWIYSVSTNVRSEAAILRGTIAVMARHGTLSRRPAKEQPPADMRDDKTATSTPDHNHIPLPSSALSIPCPDSNRCDTAGVPVPPWRRSAPAISRFHPVLGWRTILQLLARRAAESIAFSVPDRYASWSRAEDDLLVHACASAATVSRALQACSYFGGIDLCVSACNISWLPFGTVRTGHLPCVSNDRSSKGDAPEQRRAPLLCPHPPPLPPCPPLFAHAWTQVHRLSQHKLA
jgi:hypothetical protein